MYGSDTVAYANSLNVMINMNPSRNAVSGKNCHKDLSFQNAFYAISAQDAELNIKREALSFRMSVRMFHLKTIKRVPTKYDALKFAGRP
jgi:hypothetical protein